MPQSFQKEHPEQMKNLRLNSRKLTTPFDIHETLKDLLNFDNFNQDTEKQPLRGKSLFRYIPLNRSCKDAQIEPHWCSCLDWNEIELFSKTDNGQLVQNIIMNQDKQKENSENERMVYKHIEKRLAKYSQLPLLLAFESIKYLNSLIDDDLKVYCEKLHLFSIQKLSKLVINKNVLAFKRSKDIHGREALFESNFTDEQKLEDMLKPSELDRQNILNDHLNIEHVFQIVLTTWPGNGTFELSFKYNRYSGKVTFNKNEISRINRYNSSANCIINRRPDLRPYCFCK